MPKNTASLATTETNGIGSERVNLNAWAVKYKLHGTQ